MPAAVVHELYDPLYHTMQEDLYEIYRQLRDEHPVYHCKRREVWCLTRFDDVQAAARDWETFSNANGVELDVPTQFYGTGNFLEEDPPRHDLLRKVVRPFFIPKAIARLEAQVERRVEEMIAQLLGADRIDIAQDFAWALPVWVICRLLGVPEADDEHVHNLVTELETRRPGDDGHAEHVGPILRRFHEYSEDLAERKRRMPGDDLMSHLVAGEAEQAPRRDELLGLMVLLFTAGSETTAALIGNTLSFLAEHPDAQQALRQRPAELIDATIEESLRMDAPVQYLARRTTRPVLLHDEEIPAGTDVILIYGAANRDERHFERAEAFDIHRPAQRHLAFGEGIHFCLGAPLARLEARLAVPAFIQAFPSYRLESRTERFFNHIVRGYQHLPAKVD